MKKDICIKNHQNYKISVIGESNPVAILNYKNLSELENGHKNLVTELQGEKNNSEVDENEGSDFETAIKATGYGKFNWMLLFFVAWGYMSCMNSTTTMSLILPSAECDLNLSNFDKGMLNSVIFIGMTISAFFWGLVSDAIGRKIVLIVAFCLDAFFSVLVGLAQNFTFLLIAKLFTGFISSAPMAILSSYIAENHSNVYRGSIIVCSGIFTSLATIVLPFLAWLIIPQPIGIVLFNGWISLPSWRIFLLVSAIPSVVALIGFLCLDESPKFLMFQGNNEEALRVMRKIYKMNTGKPKNTFPIKSLKNEMGDDQKDLRKGTLSMKQIMSTGYKQMVPIFQKTYLLLALLPCAIMFCILFSLNTIRLWSPQLFALAIENEKNIYNSTLPSTICELLGSVSSEKEVSSVVSCNENPVEDKVYFNAMITGFVSGIGYLISGYVVKFWEKKWLMITAFSLSIACCFGLYWSSTSNILLSVVSLYTAFNSTSATALSSAVIDIFPTSLRTTAISLVMTFGRLGSMSGNLAFPLLLDLNCTAPFIVLAAVILVSPETGVFSLTMPIAVVMDETSRVSVNVTRCYNPVAASLTVLLPNTKGKHLE